MPDFEIRMFNFGFTKFDFGPKTKSRFATSKTAFLFINLARKPTSY